MEFLSPPQKRLCADKTTPQSGSSDTTIVMPEGSPRGRRTTPRASRLLSRILGNQQPSHSELSSNGKAAPKDSACGDNSTTQSAHDGRCISRRASISSDAGQCVAFGRLSLEHKQDYRKSKWGKFLCDIALPVKDTILSFCDEESLGQLSMVSAGHNAIVLGYLKSLKFSKRFERYAKDQMVRVRCCRDDFCSHHVERAGEIFRELGHLFKRATSLSTAEERICLFKQLYERMKFIEYPRTGSILAGWGRAAQIVMKGFSSQDMNSAYVAIVNFSGIKEAVSELSAVNADIERQRMVRHFYRRLFFDNPVVRRDVRLFIFWLKRVLADFDHSPERQVVLLFVIYGPRCRVTDAVEWFAPSTVTYMTHQSTTLAFGDLAIVLSFLCEDPRRIIRTAELLDRLTDYPNPWTVDNLASLLLLALNRNHGPALCHEFLKIKMAQNGVAEVVPIFESMIAVSARAAFNMRDTLLFMRDFCNQNQDQAQRSLLYRSLARMHTLNVVEIFHTYANHGGQAPILSADFQMEMNTQEAFACTLMELAFSSGPEGEVDIILPSQN